MHFFKTNLKRNGTGQLYAADFGIFERGQLLMEQVLKNFRKISEFIEIFWKNLLAGETFSRSDRNITKPCYCHSPTTTTTPTTKQP